MKSYNTRSIRLVNIFICCLNKFIRFIFNPIVIYISGFDSMSDEFLNSVHTDIIA